MRIDKLRMGEAWIKEDDATPQEAKATWDTLEKEFEDNRKMLLASAETDAIIQTIDDKFGPGTMFPASEAPIPEMTDTQRIMEWEERNRKADGGLLISQLVTPNPDGSRPGYAPQPGWKKEKEKFFKWLANNPDYDFANSSTPEIIEKSGTKFEVGTIQKFLNEEGIQTKHSIARAQDTPKYTKKVLEELRKDLPAGISVEPGRPGKYYFRIMLKGGKAGKETYRNSMVANEANKKLIIDDFNRVSKEYYPGRLTNQEFKDLRLKNKDMTTEQFAKFLDDEGKTTYLGDKWNKSSVSRLQSKLDIGVGTTGPLTIRSVDEAKKIIRQQPGAKFFFMTNPTDSEITRYAANLVSQEKLGGKGGLRGFPIGSTKENKMFRNFYDSSLKLDGRMKLLTDKPIDADGNIDWKMKDKNGVPAWKKAKFYDNKTGATYTWGKDYKPGDLRKQVDAAYGDGFFAKSVKVYDDQAKMNKMTFKGKALNEWMREGLLQKEFELKFNRKPNPTELKEWYALRKPSFSFTEAHHVEGVGNNPFRMEVSYRAANRKQNDLLNKYKSGTLTKGEYIKEMENLSDTKGGIRYKIDGRFSGATGTPKSIITAAAKDAGFNKQISNYITGKTNKPPMLSSGLSGAYDQLLNEPAMKKVLNSKGYKDFAKLAKTPGKFFGIGDVAFGYLDFLNNTQKGQDNETATKNAISAMTFGGYQGDERKRIADIKELAVKGGVSPEVFDNITVFNENQNKLVQAITNAKNNWDSYTKKGLTEEANRIEKLGGQIATNFAKNIEDAGKSLRTNLQVQEAGAPIDINVDEQWKQSFENVRSAGIDYRTQQAKEAYDTQKRQVNPGAGEIGNWLLNNIFTLNAREKADLQKQLNDMDEKELYRYNLQRGISPDQPLSGQSALEFILQNPEIFGSPQSYFDGGIASLRRKK